MSYKLQKPIRVFRSSRLDGLYAPLCRAESSTTLYRYNGLYQVRKIYDSSGKATDNDIQSSREQYTFFSRDSQQRMI
eukprot:g12197.t1 g12197   contig6:1424926-1425239(+)